MKILHKDKVKIRQVIKDYQLPHKLYTEEAISIIYSFTKKSGGKCYYTLEQIADLCYVKYRVIQSLVKKLQAAELINVKKQYNSSNIITMTPKLYTLLKPESARYADPSGTKCHLYPSKEGKKEKDEMNRFLEANPHIKRVFENQKKAFGIEYATDNVFKYIKQNQKQPV